MGQQFDDSDSQSFEEDSGADRKTSVVEILAVLSLVGGLLGYSVYQEFVEPMIAANAEKASPSPSPTLSALPKSGFPDSTAIGSLPRTTPSASRSPIADSLPTPLATPPTSNAAPGSEPAATTEIYQRAPRNGVYYAQNALQNSSRREIASSNGRFCIKLVDGPAAPESGQQQVVVSSLSIRSDGVYVDATGEKLRFDRTYTQLTDSRGTWQVLEGKGDRTGASAECLSTSGSFVRQEKGEMIQRQ
jgi:hypothetical protein